MEDAEWIKDNMKTVDELIKLDISHSGFQFMNDQSFYDGIFNRLDKHNGVDDKKEEMRLYREKPELMVQGSRLNLVQAEPTPTIQTIETAEDEDISTLLDQNFFKSMKE